MHGTGRKGYEYVKAEVSVSVLVFVNVATVEHKLKHFNFLLISTVYNVTVATVPVATVCIVY